MRRPCRSDHSFIFWTSLTERQKSQRQGLPDHISFSRPGRVTMNFESLFQEAIENNRKQWVGGDLETLGHGCEAGKG